MRHTHGLYWTESHTHFSLDAMTGLPACLNSAYSAINDLIRPYIHYQPEDVRGEKYRLERRR